MANPNVFAQFAQPVRSVIDYQNDYAKADALKNQNALQSLSLQQAANVQTQRNALRDLVQNGGTDLTTPAGQAQAISIAPDVAPALVKSVQDGITSGAAAKKDTAQAGNFTADAAGKTQDTAIAAHQQHLQQLSMVNTPEDAIAWMVQGVKDGTLPAQGLQGALQNLQTNGVQGWKAQTQQSGQTVQQQLEMTAAKPTEVKLGNVTKFIDTNPRSKTFGTEVVPAQQMGVSPDTAATTATTRRGQDMTQQTQLQVAGMGANGQISPALEAEAQLIAGGRAAPPSGMAATRPAAAMLMQRVSQINPDYDATTYGAKTAAAKGFTSGQQGNALRSISTANEHLGQLDQLGDALNNGDMNVINKIGNAYGVQTGAPPAQVFNAVKGVVAQEVVKAIVAGGGSSGERDEAAKAFSSDSSPAQLKQTIAALRTVMSAQQSNLIEQRRAAGLPDSTLPNYGGTHSPAQAATALPPDIAAILAKHGGK